MLVCFMLKKSIVCPTTQIFDMSLFLRSLPNIYIQTFTHIYSLAYVQIRGYFSFHNAYCLIYWENQEISWSLDDNHDWEMFEILSM